MPPDLMEKLLRPLIVIIGYIPAIDMHFLFAKIMFVAGSYEYIRTVLCFTTTVECWQSWDQTGLETWFVERFHCYWLHLNHISHADLLMISVFCLLILLSFGDIPIYIYTTMYSLKNVKISVQTKSDDIGYHGYTIPESLWDHVSPLSTNLGSMSSVPTSKHPKRHDTNTPLWTAAESGWITSCLIG